MIEVTKKDILVLLTDAGNGSVVSKAVCALLFRVLDESGTLQVGLGDSLAGKTDELTIEKATAVYTELAKDEPAAVLLAARVPGRFTKLWNRLTGHGSATDIG